MKENIIDFSGFKRKTSEQPGDRDAMIDVVIWPEIYCIARQAGLEPLQFRPDEISFASFMQLPITHKEIDDSFCSVYYDYCTEDTIYRAECRITFEGDGFFADTALFKLEDFKSGNREWLFFTGSDWSVGPGEDYFDIEEILDGYER